MFDSVNVYILIYCLIFLLWVFGCILFVTSYFAIMDQYSIYILLYLCCLTIRTPNTVWTYIVSSKWILEIFWAEKAWFLTQSVWGKVTVSVHLVLSSHPSALANILLTSSFYPHQSFPIITTMPIEPIVLGYDLNF